MRLWQSSCASIQILRSAALGGRPKIRFSVERLKLQRIGTYERPERSYSIISSMCRFFCAKKENRF